MSLRSMLRNRSGACTIVPAALCSVLAGPVPAQDDAMDTLGPADPDDQEVVPEPGAKVNTAPVLLDATEIVARLPAGTAVLQPLPRPDSRAEDAEADVLGWRFADAPDDDTLETEGGTARLSPGRDTSTLSFFAEADFAGRVDIPLRLVETDTDEALGTARTVILVVQVAADGDEAMPSLAPPVPEEPEPEAEALPVEAVPVAASRADDASVEEEEEEVVVTEPSIAPEVPATMPAAAAAAPADKILGLRRIAASGEAVVIAWDVRGGASYTVSRDGAELGTVERGRFVDTGVTAGMDYRYEVTSAEGASATLAVTAAAETAPDTLSPRAPGQVIALRLATGGAVVAWASGGDDRGVAGYDLYRDGRYLTTAYATAYIDTGAPDAPGTHYEVAAFDAARNYSPVSPASFVGRDAPVVGAERVSVSVTGDGTRFAFAPVNRSGSVLVLVADDAATALWPPTLEPGAQAVAFSTADASVDVLVLPAFEVAGEPASVGLTLTMGESPSSTLVFDPSALSP